MSTLQVVRSWCKCALPSKPGLGQVGVSDGMCPSCFAAEMAKLSSSPPVPTHPPIAMLPEPTLAGGLSSCSLGGAASGDADGLDVGGLVNRAGSIPAHPTNTPLDPAGPDASGRARLDHKQSPSGQHHNAAVVSNGVSAGRSPGQSGDGSPSCRTGACVTSEPVATDAQECCVRGRRASSSGISLGPDAPGQLDASPARGARRGPLFSNQVVAFLIVIGLPTALMVGAVLMRILH